MNDEVNTDTEQHDIVEASAQDFLKSVMLKLQEAQEQTGQPMIDIQLMAENGDTTGLTIMPSKAAARLLLVTSLIDEEIMIDAIARAEALEAEVQSEQSQIIH